MRKELVKLDNFRVYAKFLYENYLDDLVKADIKRSYELDLPLLKLFANLSEEQLFQVSKAGVEEYLLQVIEDNYYEAIIKNNNDWREDRLTIPRDKVVASDLALIYNVRKYSLIGFLPKYTKEPEQMVKILKEIEDFYTFQ